jgi:hypothetical protein
MSDSLELLLALADEFGATAKLVGASAAELNIALPRLDGRVTSYTIHVSCLGTQLHAKEAESCHLPSFCPERHINLNGSFCLYWEEDDLLEVTDHESARTWLETLYKFLLAQERVGRKKRWPSSKAWAHGDAARFQLKAMRAAARLGDAFVERLEHGGLTAVTFPRRGRNCDSTLAVEQDGRQLYAIWESRRMAVNKKQRCFCGLSGSRRPKRLGRCANHATAALELAEALFGWQRAEAQFWKSMQGHPCCGTCNACPLAAQE